MGFSLQDWRVLAMAAVSLFHALTFALTNEDDVYAMNTLYTALDAPPLKGWTDFGGDPCGEQWEGVTCANGSQITTLNLSGMNLTGELGFAFSTMTSLISLDMSKNSLYGPLPSPLPPTMQDLNLAENEFSGALSICLKDLSQMVTLNLSNNALCGSLPNIFNQSKSLVSIDLSYNYFNASLPTSLRALRNLATLHLQNNQFNGTLDVLANLSLKELDISHNRFRGKVPESLLSIPAFKDGGNFLIAGEPSYTPSPEPADASSSSPFYNGPLYLSPPPINDMGSYVPPPVPSPRYHIPSEVATIPSFNMNMKPHLTEAHIVAIATAGMIGLLATVLVFIIISWKVYKQTHKEVGSPSQVEHMLSPSRARFKTSPLGGPPVPVATKQSPKLQSPLSDRVASSLSGTQGNLFPNVNAPAYTFNEIRAATNKFGRHSLIGEGSLGRVYKVQFPNGQVFAVKKLNGLMAKVPEEAFVNVLSRVSQLRNANITELTGFCMEQGQRLLVYGYVKNGTLYDALHSGEERSSALTWNVRMKIALGAARALEYLHEVCEPPIVHKNFKSSNILLDEDFEPRVSDCGLAALVPFESGHQISIQNFSSFGYSAPEYTLTGVYTVKSDVYSFGVVMLELLAGRKPLDRLKPRAEQSLVRWATPQLQDMDGLAKMVDPALRGIYPAKSLLLFADIILRCVQREPDRRPTMSEVTQSMANLVQRVGSRRQSREDLLSSSLRLMHVAQQGSSSPSYST